jgi:hypothetical protein
MDISKINIVKAATDGIDVDIINPATNESLGLKIRVIGAMSANYKDEMFLLLAEVEDYQETNKVSDPATKKQKAEAQIKADKFDTELTAKFLAKYTIGWQEMEENGKPVPFSTAEAERIYLEYPIIRGQVQRAMMDISNFIKA